MPCNNTMLVGQATPLLLLLLLLLLTGKPFGMRFGGECFGEHFINEKST